MKRIAFVFILFSFIVVGAVGQTKQVSDTTSKKEFQDSLAFELCQIYGLDQGIRQWNIGCGAEGMLKIDSVNYNKILDFIEKYGFPSYSLLGENFKYECVQMAAIAVLLHNPHKISKDKKVLELLVREYKKGNMTEGTLYFIIDKYYYFKTYKTTKKVYYGPSWKTKPCIQDRAISDSLRLDIGLPPLKDEDFRDCSE